MLSYRHSFHAGNFADVLKHLVLVRLLRYMCQKQAPLLYLDTHAGAGGYELGVSRQAKTQEFLNGIGKLWDRSDLPEELADYVALVRQFNNSDRLSRYPGSPWFAQHLLRSNDRLVLHELHPTDFVLLQENVSGDRRVQVRREDGFNACKALLPPRERRALVLIDPPYELKEDYRRIVDTLLAAHRKFASGVFAIWYPVVERQRIKYLEKTLAASGIRKILLLELGVSADRPGLGMTASGMILVNPPWSLSHEISQLLPYLALLLGKDGKGHFRVQELVGE